MRSEPFYSLAGQGPIGFNAKDVVKEFVDPLRLTVVADED